MRSYIVCVKCGHRLKSTTVEVVCPLCKSALKFIGTPEEKSKDYRENNRGGDNYDKYRMPWLKNYGEMKNNENVINSGKRWTLEEASILKEFWDEIGMGDEETWSPIAEEFFERSVFAVEHKLRIMWAIDEGETTLEKEF